MQHKGAEAANERLAGLRNNWEGRPVLRLALILIRWGAMRPKVSFDSRNIWRRLESCKTVAHAYGWPPDDIIRFGREVEQAFSYEDAMAVIERKFDVLKKSEAEPR